MTIFRRLPGSQAKVQLLKPPTGKALDRARTEFVMANGKRGGEAEFKKYIADLLKIRQSIKQTIPEELVDLLKKESAEPLSSKSGIKEVAAPQAVSDLRKLAQQIARPATRMQVATYLYYKASLQTLVEALQEPQVPPRFNGTYYKGNEDTNYQGYDTPFRRAFTLKTNGAEAKAIGLNRADTVEVSGVFSALRPYTLWEKDELLSTTPTYWKHTGKGFAAFRSAARTRLSSLRYSNFAKVTTPQASQGVTAFTLGRGKNKKTYGRVSYQVEIGIPAWNPKMDLLFTVPFATGKVVSLTTGLGLNFTRPEQNEDGAYINTQLRGIDRILAAESKRPWLRALAIEGGTALRKYLGLPTPPGGSLAQLAKAEQNLKRNIPKRRRTTPPTVKRAKERATDQMRLNEALEELKAQELKLKRAMEMEALRTFGGGRAVKTDRSGKWRSTEIAENNKRFDELKAKNAAIKAELKAKNQRYLSTRSTAEWKSLKEKEVQQAQAAEKRYKKKSRLKLIADIANRFKK